MYWSTFTLIKNKEIFTWLQLIFLSKGWTESSRELYAMQWIGPSQKLICISFLKRHLEKLKKGVKCTVRYDIQ